MSLILIRRALEKRLDALPNGLATAFENVSFQPVNGVPYQRAALLPATPDNSTFGARLHLALGIFQISLFYPTGTGPAAIDARAELLKQHFARGLSWTESGVNVLSTHTPAISPGMADGDRFHVPVSVRWQAFIAT